MKNGNSILAVIMIIMIFIAVGVAAVFTLRLSEAEQPPIAAELEIIPTPSPSPAPTMPEPEEPETTEPEFTGINYMEQGGRFELPINGATGWTPVVTALRNEPDSQATSVQTLSAGQAFTIISEQDDWWNVELPSGETGWIFARNCFINLPDIAPSIIYDITNATSSIARSNGFAIPNVTGHSLYNARAFNPRLGRDEYIVPALYSTAIKIANAQRIATANGDTLVIYEVFRPRMVQQTMVNNLQELMQNNTEVNNAINAPPWGISWFISTSLSNHQRGAAIDVALARIINQETALSGDFMYTRITRIQNYIMPSEMHELSPLAVALAYPVSSTSPLAWREVPPSAGMTEGALLMQEYFDLAGLMPLASEWWHFNDLEGGQIARDLGITGDFFTETVYSVPIYND